LSGYKDFADGNYFTAAEVDGYLMQQTVMRFATTADLLSQLGSGVRVAGMLAYATDTATLYMYEGSGVWKPMTSQWASYTPTWNGPTALNIGNGSITGRWRYAGGMVFVHIELTRGSTTNVGTSSYSWTLPVTAKTNLAAIGYAFARDASPFAEYGGIVIPTSSTGVAVVNTATNTRWSNTVPFTPATDDTYTLNIEYEPLNGIS
jgi:hypothetical protein